MKNLTRPEIEKLIERINENMKNIRFNNFKTYENNRNNVVSQFYSFREAFKMEKLLDEDMFMKQLLSNFRFETDNYNNFESQKLDFNKYNLNKYYKNYKKDELNKLMLSYSSTNNNEEILKNIMKNFEENEKTLILLIVYSCIAIRNDEYLSDLYSRIHIMNWFSEIGFGFKKVFLKIKYNYYYYSNAFSIFFIILSLLEPKSLKKSFVKYSS